MPAACGVRADGRREVLGFRLAGSESAAAWESFFEGQYRRGIKGAKLELLTVAGGGGAKAGQEVVYPQVPRRRCQVHKPRKVAVKVRVRHRGEGLGGAGRICKARSCRVAVRRCRRWAGKWRKLEPKAVACLEVDIEELPARVRVLRTEPERVGRRNVVERQFREWRKRIRPMCSFANGGSGGRVVCALFERASKRSEQRWMSQRRPRVNRRAA